MAFLCAAFLGILIALRGQEGGEGSPESLARLGFTERLMGLAVTLSKSWPPNRAAVTQSMLSHVM